MASSFELLQDLSWWRLKAGLLSLIHHSRPWLTVFQAIIKAITIRTAELYNLPELKNSNTIFFHIPGKNFNARITEGTPVELEVIFTYMEKDHINLWRKTFIEYFQEEELSKRFLLRSTGDIETRTIHDLFKSYERLPQEGEICLEFLTPLAFSPPRKKERTILTQEQFIKLITERLKLLFAREIPYQSLEDDWRLLPYYWHYTELRHESLSQPGRIKYINGCTGKLYIKGRWKNLLPYLILTEELHMGTKITYGRGYFRLHLEPISFFNNFPDKRELLSIITETLSRTDTELPMEKNEEKLADDIYSELKEKRYNPSPHIAFKVDNSRVFEKLTFKDLIVHEYLLRLLEEPLNRTLEPTVLAYRKGISLKDGYELIQKAILEGYEYVAIFDLESFYPEIRHEILINMLKEILPEKDSPVLELLNTVLKTGYVLSNNHYKRTKGLSTGSPFSTLLANYYLHPLDRKLNEETILIRYADKFLLLSKTPESLKEALASAEALLEELNLRLDKKSLITCHYTEGFKFCGLIFDGANFQENTYRKPLYITEHDVFIGVNSDAIEIRKGNEVINSIPIHRISEIIVTCRASFSTAFLERVLKKDIPVTVQLGSGYSMTTIRPDSKEYYTLSAIHTRFYSELSEDEIRSIASLIVNSKVRSYTELFKKKYEKRNTDINSYLEEILEKLKKARNLNELRAYEALAAKRCFKELNCLINNRAFTFTERKRKTTDRINSLLNFGYYLLFSKLNATVRATGLNPYLGFLHEPANRYESLVADLQELFRARIDNFIIKLINLGVFTEKDFEETARGFRLNGDAKKKFIHHFESEMDRKYAHDLYTLEETIYEQVLQIKRWILEEDELFFYMVMP